MENWVKTKLTDVCDIKKGEQLNKLNLESSGDYPCINGGISPSGYTDNWNTEANTITISEGGNSCGFINLLKTRFWSGGHCYSLLQIKNSINHDFLYYALKGRESLVMDLRVGSGLPNIQQKAIRNFEFIYPKEKSEQQKIAEILSKTDKAITETEALIAKYNRIKTGLMQDLLTKGIDENGQIRSEETHEFKESALGRIPKEWKVRSINDLCTIIVDCKNRTSPFVEKSNYPVIRTSNVKNGSLVWDDIKYTDAYSYKIWTERAVPVTDDIIITREAPLGQVLKIPKGITPILGQRTMLYKTNREFLLPDFLVYSIMDERMQKYLNNLGGGSTVHHLKVGEMRSFCIALPTKTNEQFKIISRINKEIEFINLLILQKTKLQSLKTGIMQDLLSGKVRVNEK